MTITPFQALACPLDGSPLQRDGSAWRCASGHSFDIAKQGYTNLLRVQNKRSLDPGDSKLMVAARRHYLNAGFYQPIAAAVSQAVLVELKGSVPFKKPKNHENGTKGLNYIPSVPLMPLTINGDHEY